MKVNTEKTKIVVFKRGGCLSRKEKWYYEGKQLEVVNGFTYVGVYFTNRLSLYKMADAVATKAKRVLNYIFSSFYELSCIPVNTFFKVFDSKISSVLLYGSEIWGLQYMHCIENVHVQACKRLLGLSSTSCNDAVMSDLGR